MGIMTRVEMLAKALRGEVVEDEGYRGVIHRDGEYIRYHSTHGVHVVERNLRTWRAVRPIMSPEEVRPFLEAAGVLPVIDLSKPRDPLSKLHSLLGGDVVQKFATGGGVIHLPTGNYLRYSPIAGLAIVEFVVTKWRIVKRIMDRNETLKTLLNDHERIREVIYGSGDHSAVVSGADPGGDQPSPRPAA